MNYPKARISRRAVQRATRKLLYAHS